MAVACLQLWSSATHVPWKMQPIHGRQMQEEDITDLIKGGLFPWPSLDPNYFL